MNQDSMYTCSRTIVWLVRVRAWNKYLIELRDQVFDMAVLSNRINNKQRNER